MANSIQFTVALAVAMAFTQAQAATANELKATIDAYGLSATVVPSMTGSNAVNVTGTNTNATSSLDLDIGAGIVVNWQAQLTGNIGSDIGGPAEVTQCLVCNSGSGTLTILSGNIDNSGGNSITIGNRSNGTININGGTITAAGLNFAVSSGTTGTLNLSGTPTITGRILLMKSNPIRVGSDFVPGEKIYNLKYDEYTAGMTVVKNGGNFSSNFQYAEIPGGLTTVASGNDLILTALTGGSSSSTTQSSSSDSPVPILTGKTITLENLPKNTKIEIYNLQGKLIYSAYPENPKILRIGVQTKGIYIVKINNTRTVKMAVM